MNKRLQKLKAEHNEWLWLMGVHPDQLKQKKSSTIKTYIPTKISNDSYLPKLSNQIGNGFKTGVMVNLYKETPEVQKQILDKAKRVAPAYNKGGLQYITDNCDLTTLGRKV